MRAPVELSNEVVLRPRFNRELTTDPGELLELFEQVGREQDSYVVTRVDDHVFIRFPRSDQHFWSPQLDLEITPSETGQTHLRGLFGPKPTVWTMFMFLHFVVASLFIGFGAWAYSNYSLDKSMVMQLFVMALLVLLWFVLYFAGRMGKAAGRPQMRELHDFMQDVLQR